MNPIKALIIDDEKHVIESLRALLRLYCPNVEVVADAGSIPEGLQKINIFGPDLVFLDIAIGEESGFDLLNQLQPLSFHLIFVTGYSEFAIKAFRYNALDYLLKPIIPQQLMEAVEKARHSSNPDQLQQQLVHLLDSFKTQNNETITVSTNDGLHFIDVMSIIKVKGDGAYSSFFLDSQEIITASKHLKYYERLLPPKQFFRTHQSFLVNKKFIKKIKSAEGGSVELKDGSDIPLARSRKEELIQFLKR